jgi:hypothetical protein
LGRELVLSGYKLWLVPAFADPELAVIAGIGERKDHIPYNEEDFYWLDDIVEEIAWMVSTYWKGKPHAFESAERIPGSASEMLEPAVKLDTGEFLSKLAYKPDPELERSVEECLRNLNDYSLLGKSSWYPCLPSGSGSHRIGQTGTAQAYRIIEKLRPATRCQVNPCTREWYAYTILHDAYVENCLSREIMSKLYISGHIPDAPACSAGSACHVRDGYDRLTLIYSVN